MQVNYIQKSNEIYENPTGNLKTLLNKNGFGPRRKKRHDEIAMAKDNIEGVIHHMIHMPLWCWKIYVNCAIFPKHVCCPVMYKKPNTKQSPQDYKKVNRDI